MNHSSINGQNSAELENSLLWDEAELCPPEYKIGYEQSTFFLREGQDYRVLPNEKPNDLGFFSAYPKGLKIDKNTGEIDVNASHSGLRYTVEFTPCGKQCVARTHVTISGVDYLGRIFSLSNSKEEEYKTKPFYNGIADNYDFRGRFGIIPDKQLVSANLKGLFIDPITGEIDLKKTIESGALGFRKKRDGSNELDCYPENGASKEFKVYYHLDDDSKNAINSTTVRIHFYDSIDDIPVELFIRVKQQSNTVKRAIKALPWPILLGTALSVLPDSPWFTVGAVLASIPLVFMTLRSSDNPYKPPEHIATK